MPREGLLWQAKFFEADLEDFQDQGQFGIGNDAITCL